MNAAAVLRAAAEGIRPDRPLRVSEWANANLVLAKRSSAEPGAYRWERTPYVREPMDNLSSDSPIETTILMWGAQIGKTTIGLAWAGYIIDHYPGPSMIVQPTGAVARRFTQTRLDAIIAASPRLRAKIPPARQRDSRNTVESKLFDGGSLIITPPTGPRLREAAIQNLILDEVDGYPALVADEGGPLELVQARQRTFPRRKKLIISTPTVAGHSLIERLFLASDQRRYHVPCPHCQARQPLEFPRLTWTALDLEPEEAVYRCAACEQPIPEHYKTGMLAAGHWVPTRPEAEDAATRGYHLNALYSPVGWLSWGQIARQWVDGQADPIRRRSIVNTIFAETWRERGEAPEWERLMRRRGPYSEGICPALVRVVTAGVDVQKIKLVVEVVGWGPAHQSWSITWAELDGDTGDLSSTGPWAALERLLLTTFPHEGGGVLPIRMMAIDSGHQTGTVYEFVRRHPVTTMAVKGSSIGQLLGTPTVVDISHAGRKITVRAVKVWPVGDAVSKEEFYSWLRLEPPLDGGAPPPGLCSFPDEYDATYFKGLCSEELLEHTRPLRRRNAMPHREWALIPGRRNELLDCRRYARAAGVRLGLDRLTDAQWAALRPQPAAVDDEADAPPDDAEVVLV